MFVLVLLFSTISIVSQREFPLALFSFRKSEPLTLRFEWHFFVSPSAMENLLLILLSSSSSLTFTVNHNENETLLRYP